jgi:DNA polymerase-1
MTKVQELLLLIDADYFFYRAASSSEYEMQYSEDLTVIAGDFNKGKSMVKHELKQLRERFDTDNILLTFTASDNFRKDIDPSYKGNRTKRKPCGYLKLKNWGLETYESVLKPRLEADDVMGILATNGLLKNFVLISPDKDMAQIACRIYDLKTEYTQTPGAAKRLLYKQTLTGDSTDGYKGCPGIGPKNADRILDTVKDEDYWPAVVKAFEEAELTEADALRNFYLARILQVGDYDTTNQVPLFPHETK